MFLRNVAEFALASDKVTNTAYCGWVQVSVEN